MTPRAPVRVLSVAQYGREEVGGAERYAAEVGDRLQDAHGLQLRTLSAVPAVGVSAPSLSVGSAGYHPAWPRQLDAALAAYRPDVLYAHHTVPGLVDVALRAAARAGVPAAVMYHSDVTGEAWPKRWTGRAYQAAVGRGSLAAVEVVFVASAAFAAASAGLRGVSARVVEAVPGVDPAFRAARRRPGAYLLFVGKPERTHKGLAVLLAAWPRVRRAHPDARLLIAGEASTRPPDADGISWLGQVRSRPELADLMAGAHAVVMPSLWPEPFGMVAAEALCAGAPVVASDVGGVRSLVQDGRNGMLVPPGDAPALAAALDAMLCGGARFRRVVAAEADAYARRFDWDATAAGVAGELIGLALKRAAPVPA